MPRYTEEELISLLHQYYTEFGTCPSPRCLDNNVRYPSARIYQKRFGTWKNALIAAELRSKLNESFFNNVNTNIQWYYIGFLIGDGSIVKDPSGKYCKLSVALQATDIKWLEDFKCVLNTDNKIIYDSNRNSNKLTITSNEIIADLSNYNVIPLKSWNCRLPLSKINSSNHAAAFLHGLLDADGHIGVYDYDYQSYNLISFVGTHQVCLDIRTLLQQYLDISDGNIYHNSDVTSTIKWANKSEFVKILDFLYSNEELYEICLERKLQMYREIKNDR
jgi:hypothetical protein